MPHISGLRDSKFMFRGIGDSESGLVTPAAVGPVVPSWPVILDTNLVLRVESYDWDALADTTALTQWLDKSGNANDFGLYRAGDEPWVDQVRTLNGHATGRFIRSTNDRHFYRGSTWNGSPTWSQGEILAIMQVDNDPATGDLGAPFKFGNSSGSDSHVPLNDGNVYENIFDATRPNSGNPTTSFASWVGYNVRGVQFGNRSIYVGTELLVNAAVGVWTNPVPGSGLTIGNSWAGLYIPPTYPHRSMDGNLAAVYLWNIVLSGAQRAALVTYINDLWGLTISST